jgi:hypothetical protein
MARWKPKIDPATTGISFVDILFALAVGEVLMPLAPWAEDHTKHSLPAPIVWNLAVALVLILTSFIGYHNSENRPRFKIKFINISFWKFVLDILMVVVYFLFAAFAAVSPAQTQSLLLLLLLVFALYVLWDLAGWYEKLCGKYKPVWEAAYADPNRPDIVDAWTEVNYWRILPSVGVLLLVAGIYAWSLHQGTPLPREDVIRVDLLLVVVLLVYRVVKDVIPDNPTSSGADTPEPTVTFRVDASQHDLSSGLGVVIKSTTGTTTGSILRTQDPPA